MTLDDTVPANTPTSDKTLPETPVPETPEGPALVDTAPAEAPGPGDAVLTRAGTEPEAEALAEEGGGSDAGSDDSAEATDASPGSASAEPSEEEAEAEDGAARSDAAPAELAAAQSEAPEIIAGPAGEGVPAEASMEASSATTESGGPEQADDAAEPSDGPASDESEPLPAEATEEPAPSEDATGSTETDLPVEPETARADELPVQTRAREREEPAETEHAETAVVHKPMAHDSAALHVAGTARYVDDIAAPQGTLHLAPGWCRTAARGRIVGLDLEPVMSHPGVVRVITARDIPGTNDCSSGFDDDPVLCEGEIQFWGQVVFLVVAETREAARRAAAKAVFEVRATPPLITAAQAREAGSEVLPPYRFKRGDAESAIAAAPHRLAGRLAIGGQEHFYLEGQVALALPGEAGDMVVHSSTQHPSEVQHVVAKMLGTPHAAVTVECRRMGGGFGGKESQANQWACLAALAARLTGRPAKLRLDRDDDFIMTGKRHDNDVEYAVGFDDDGRILATDLTFAARCGYSVDLSLGVNDRTMFHADNAYYYPETSILSLRLRTNTCSNTAFRGFGGPQGVLAAERVIDAIAIRLGKDPLEIRKANFYGEGRDVTPYGMKVTDNILPEVTARLEAVSDYAARREAIEAFNERSRILKRGIAITPVKFGISFTLSHLNQGGALVHVYTDGSVHLSHGGTEMGQGLYVKVAQVVAEEFGIPLERVKIAATTTGKVPNTPPTAASSGADLNGMAARAAARQIKDRMAAFAADMHGVEPDAVRFANGEVTAGSATIPFGDLARQAFLARVSLSSTGYYRTPKIHWDREAATGRPFLYFAYGAACSEVVVDTMTGEMKVERIDIVHDCGRSLNPAIDMGQIEGGFVQGMGWLTTEELVWDDAGRLRTHAPSTYKIPTASDVPAAFNVEIFDGGPNREPTIYRSKAVGEPPLMLASSVFSAILHAVASLRPGIVPQLDAPATPEAIMRAVRSMRQPAGT